jgi:hypothetical protein
MIIFHNTFISVRKHVANPYPLYSCHHHDITEMLLKVALNTKTLQPLYSCQVTIEMLIIASDDGSSYINLKPEMRHYIGYTLSIT